MEQRELLVAVKSGCSASFEKLYLLYWRKVFNFAKLYLTSQDAAEEVVQEVFVKLWESRGLIREEDNFQGMLFIVTRNIIFNQRRKYLNTEFYKMTILSALDSAENELEQELEARDLGQFIDALIAEMPPKRREIFNLSRKGHLTYREIAAKLSISEKTIENQINAALRHLRKNMLLFSFFI